MSTYKVITDAQGRMSTTHAPSDSAVREQLNETRKQVRDMIAGNVQFHDDEQSQTVSSAPASRDLWVLWDWSVGQSIPDYLVVRLANGREHAVVPDWCWTRAFPPSDQWVVAYRRLTT